MHNNGNTMTNGTYYAIVNSQEPSLQADTLIYVHYQHCCSTTK